MAKIKRSLPGQEEEILREQIIAGRCALFLGSDVDYDILPGRARLARQLAVYHGWASLDATAFPWMAQRYELEHGRASLVSFVKEEIGRVHEPPACHRTIAALPFRLILTTSYDTLLEKALDERGVAYQKILGDYDLRHGMLDRVRIVKLYGCITEPDSLVITEEDQFAFFDRWPGILDALGMGFSGKTPLFIGCDLAHRDFRHIYHYLAPRLSQSAYLVQRGVASSLAHYWATRGLTVIEAEAAEFLSRATEYVEVEEAKARPERRLRRAQSSRRRETPPTPIFEPLALEVAHGTETGRSHRVNQDCLVTYVPSDPQKHRRGNLFLVADGMGGHNAGGSASRLAVDVTVEEYYADAEEEVSASLTHAIEAANEAICQQARENSALSNMGTTVVAAVVREQELHVANVGDSRAYLIRGEEIGQITLDHSWVAEEIRAGRMTPDEARTHPQRNLLTRALGLGAQVEVDIFQRNLETGDIIVLCSDGLTEYVKDGEIKETVNKYSSALATRRLVKLASDRGGSDDISVIVVKTSEEPS